MNARTVIGLCVFAALSGGVIAGGLISASPPTASASGTTSGWDHDRDDDPEVARYYRYECTVAISHASVEDSNFCSPGATAGGRGGSRHDGHDGRHGDRDGDDWGPGDDGDNVVMGSQDCQQAGLVNVQACHVVRDIHVERILSDNDVLSENDVDVKTVVKDNTVVTTILGTPDRVLRD